MSLSTKTPQNPDLANPSSCHSSLGPLRLPQSFYGDAFTTFLYGAAICCIVTKVDAGYSWSNFGLLAIIYIFFDWVSRILLPSCLPNDDLAVRNRIYLNVLKALLEAAGLYLLTAFLLSVFTTPLYGLFAGFLIVNLLWNLLLLYIMGGLGWRDLQDVCFKGNGMDNEAIALHSSTITEIEALIEKADISTDNANTSSQVIKTYNNHIKLRSSINSIGAIYRMLIQLFAFHVRYGYVVIVIFVAKMLLESTTNTWGSFLLKKTYFSVVLDFAQVTTMHISIFCDNGYLDEIFLTVLILILCGFVLRSVNISNVFQSDWWKSYIASIKDKNYEMLVPWMKIICSVPLFFACLYILYIICFVVYTYYPQLFAGIDSEGVGIGFPILLFIYILLFFIPFLFFKYAQLNKIMKKSIASNGDNHKNHASISCSCPPSKIQGEEENKAIVIENLRFQQACRNGSLSLYIILLLLYFALPIKDFAIFIAFQQACVTLFLCIAVSCPLEQRDEPIGNLCRMNSPRPTSCPPNINDGLDDTTSVTPKEQVTSS
jgi:hypothetical protein